jgi:hypothetical protein
VSRHVGLVRGQGVQLRTRLDAVPILPALVPTAIALLGLRCAAEPAAIGRSRPVLGMPVGRRGDP